MLDVQRRSRNVYQNQNPEPSPMALGEQLREARRRMNLTPSEVASATRVKVQIIEAIEAEDFSKIAAPIYGKGFIKLFAEYVGLEAQPLIQEYLTQVGATQEPGTLSGTTEEQKPARKREKAPKKSRLDPQPDERAAERSAECDLFNADSEKQPAETTAEPRAGDRLAVLLELAARARDGLVQARDRLRAAWASARQKTEELKAERDPWKLAPIALGVLLVLVFLVSGLSRCMRGGDRDTGMATSGQGDTLHIAVDSPEPYFD